MAEQLGGHQALGQRAAVHPDERPFRTRRAGMDRARDQLLAGPGLARHEHGRVGGGDTSHAVEHAAQGRRLADHAERGAARGDHVGAGCTAGRVSEHGRERGEARVRVLSERLAARLEVAGNGDWVDMARLLFRLCPTRRRALWDFACRRDNLLSGRAEHSVGAAGTASSRSGRLFRVRG